MSAELINQPVALYMEKSVGSPNGKMGYGILRFASYPVSCVIDSSKAGTDLRSHIETPRTCPIVSSVEEAKALGAEVMVLGTAPSGGQIPEEWYIAIEKAVSLGLSIFNGAHDQLAPRYPDLNVEQWIWDARVPRELGHIGMAAARQLKNQRVLMIGTDMAQGKMTAGLVLTQGLLDAGRRAVFLATGQVGIAITGSGIPLDAFPVDFAAGAVEQLVLSHQAAEVMIIEGQGSLINPSSTANLPLLRGSCPTDLVLNHRAGQMHLKEHPWLRIPPLTDVIRLYEDVSEAAGTLPRAKTKAICLNTSHLSAEDAARAVKETEDKTGLPTRDVVRDGVGDLPAAITAR